MWNERQHGSQPGQDGQRGRVRLDEVVAWINGWAAAVRAETIALGEAAGRVLAERMEAALDLPPFDRAAADGIALRADETVGASAYNPLPFRLNHAAGDLAAAGLAAGSAVKVRSGDPLPAGADAMVRLEHIVPDGEGAVAIIAPSVAGSDI